MTEEMRKHYEAVFNDIMENGPSLFKGIYDAHTKQTRYFMFGVETVMDYIAGKVSDECYWNFDSTYVNNMIKSEENS